jgi:acetylornithine/succinyldiaminopimelate/putrescine aminotransferase
LLRGLLVSSRAADIYARCRDAGVLLSLAGGSVVRFVPALNVEAAHLDEAVDVLEGVIRGLD